MSRIGRLPIAVPSGVEVTIDGRDLQVKGPKGSLALSVSAPITIDRNDEGQLVVERPDDERVSRSLHGLTRTLVNNMVQDAQVRSSVGAGGQIEQKAYRLPAGTTWEQVQSFYNDKLGGDGI